MQTIAANAPNPDSHRSVRKWTIEGAYHFRRYFSVTALDPCAMLSIMTNDETPKHEGMTKYPNTQARRKTEVRMTNNLPESGDQARKKPYDLEERTALFGESVIDYLKKVPVTPVTRRLIDQLVGAGTSIGANYCEADDAVSKKDFRHKISICKREAREATFFLRMLARAVPELQDEARGLWQEAKELHLIFAKIYRG